MSYTDLQRQVDVIRKTLLYLLTINSDNKIIRIPIRGTQKRVLSHFAWDPKGWNLCLGKQDLVPYKIRDKIVILIFFSLFYK